MLRQVLKFLIGLGVAAIVVIAVRAYAFTIYTAPSTITPILERGDRLLVNKVSSAPYSKGDLIVFTVNAKGMTAADGQPLTAGTFVGLITAMPGDTITLQRQRYLIPQICCRKCGCTDCKLYLVNVGGRNTLVHKHQIVGHAKRLFHLPHLDWK